MKEWSADPLGVHARNFKTKKKTRHFLHYILKKPACKKKKYESDTTCMTVGSIYLKEKKICLEEKEGKLKYI